MDEYAARPGEICVRSQSRSANSGLAAGDNETAEQCTDKNTNPVWHRAIPPFLKTWLRTKNGWKHNATT
jgi:hypothetical protein